MYAKNKLGQRKRTHLLAQQKSQASSIMTVHRPRIRANLPSISGVIASYRQQSSE